jgi:hypothetical protein
MGTCPCMPVQACKVCHGEDAGCSYRRSQASGAIHSRLQRRMVHTLAPGLFEGWTWVCRLRPIAVRMLPLHGSMEALHTACVLVER